MGTFTRETNRFVCALKVGKAKNRDLTTRFFAV